MGTEEDGVNECFNQPRLGTLHRLKLRNQQERWQADAPRIRDAQEIGQVLDSTDVQRSWSSFLCGSSIEQYFENVEPLRMFRRRRRPGGIDVEFCVIDFLIEYENPNRRGSRTDVIGRK